MKKRLIISLLLSFLATTVQAASFGTYRIYLDTKITKDKFIVKNRSVFPEQCELSISYRKYKENGQLIKLTKAEQEELTKSTIARMRFSPRKFTIAPKSNQYVNFRFRRQINDIVAEHRSYVYFVCTKLKKVQTQVGLTLTPSIHHQIPLVIRTAPLSKMSLNLTFSKIKRVNSAITFRVQHSGNRSFMGDIYVMALDGTKLLTLQRNVAIYPDMVYKDFTFDLEEFHDKEIKLVLEENDQYGGNRHFELTVQGIGK